MSDDGMVQEVEQEDDSLDFESGFEGVPTEKPVAEEPVEVEATQPAPKMAQITEEQYQQLLERAASIDQIKAAQEKGLTTAFGKIGGIERVLNQIQSASGAVEVSDDDFDEMRKEFPELAALHVQGLKKVLSKMRPASNALDPTQIDSLVQQRISPVLDSVSERVERLVGEKLLTKTHKDWKEVTANDEFKAWFFSQPAEYQSVVGNSFDPDVVGEAIDTFKASKQKAIAASTRQKRIESAVTPRGTGGHQPARSDDDDFHAGFNS